MGGTSGGRASGGAANGGAANGGAANGGTAGNSAGSSAGGAITTDPGVRVVGRTAAGGASGSLRFSWSGVNINARFTGTQVSMNLNDGTNQNRFTVVVDSGMPAVVTSPSGQGAIALASGLANGPHTLLVWRNTEASRGVTQFNGLSNFGPGGSLLAAPPPPDRRIEVIGDSISAGAGAEGNAACPGGIDAFTNNYVAYGSVAARAVSADCVTIAWSGIGVYRNYDGSTTNTMPARYPSAIPNDGSAWDFSRYQPQVVVMNLGTNDFGQGDPGTPYETAYVAFAKTVRSKYPSASFVLIDMYGGNRLTRINTVAASLKSAGDLKVDVLSLSSAQNNLGCNQHPNVAAHAAMGNLLATRLKSLMNW